MNGVWTEGELPREYADGGRSRKLTRQASMQLQLYDVAGNGVGNAG
jgi:hypothetical protein